MKKFYILFYNKPIKLKIDIYIIGYQFFSSFRFLRSLYFFWYFMPEIQMYKLSLWIIINIYININNFNEILLKISTYKTWKDKMKVVVKQYFINYYNYQL